MQISYTKHDVNGSLLTVELLFKRQFSGFVVTTFIPIMLIIIISFITLFFEKDDFTNRVMVTISLFIVLASLFSQTSNNLPHTSYIKCIDVVFLCPIVFISLVFACHVLLSLKHRRAVHTVIKVQKSHGVSKPSWCYPFLSRGDQVALAVCCCALLTFAPLVLFQCYF